MLNFTFQDQDYNVPTGPDDVTLGKYLSFLQEVAVNEPTEIANHRQLGAQVITLLDQIDDHSKRSGVDQKLPINLYIETIGVWLDSGNATPKAKRYLLPLLNEARVKLRELNEITEKMDNLWISKTLLPYMVSVISHFTGIDQDAITHHMDRKSLNYLYGLIMKAMNVPDSVDYAKTYIVQGEVYELPDKYMEDSTLIEFAEAAQFEASMEGLRNGEAYALLDVISVILRKPGEAYSEQVYKRNRETFKAVTLQQSAEINFFLLKRSERYALDFLSYQVQVAATQVSRALVN